MCQKSWSLTIDKISNISPVQKGGMGPLGTSPCLSLWLVSPLYPRCKWQAGRSYLSFLFCTLYVFQILFVVFYLSKVVTYRFSSIFRLSHFCCWFNWTWSSQNVWFSCKCTVASPLVGGPCVSLGSMLSVSQGTKCANWELHKLYHAGREEARGSIMT